MFRQYVKYVVVVICAIFSVLWLLMRGKGVDGEKVMNDVTLLSGLVDSGNVVNSNTGNTIDYNDSLKKKSVDVWKVDDGSVVRWSVDKIVGGEHHGTINVQGQIFVDRDSGEILVGRSHVTLLMNSFDVQGMKNEGVKSLFLDHLKGDEFLDVVTFPRGQFVIDEVGISNSESKDLIGNDRISTFIDGKIVDVQGRLKLKNTIDTLDIDHVEIRCDMSDECFVSGSFSFSRYVRGLDAMPGIIDEFIVVDFDVGVSK